MPANDSFDELLGRIRRGDAEAAAELVRRHQSAIRVAVRTRLSDPALRRQLDSIDICQSVLASFFLRAAAGQYDLRDPAQLVALLTKMAHNKLTMHVRSQHRQCREVRRMTQLTVEMNELPASTAQPIQQVANRDLLDKAYELMDPQVRQIAASRCQGADWNDIATELGGTADARRKQFRRAMNRIAETLQID